MIRLDMKLALVHDYLSQYGGAERVLLAMREMWPEAPIFVLFHDREKMAQFAEADVHESFLAGLPGIHSCFQWYLPFMPLATEHLDLSEFDVVVSSTSAFAKGVITRPDAVHISYCHTPARYLWTDTREYIAELKRGRLVKWALPPVLHWLRLWDAVGANRVDYFIANSRTVADRIRKFYRRDSVVIYPPVDTDKFSLATDIGDYFATGGRLVPYKRLDLAVHAFNRLRWPLKIFGDGPEMAELKRRAMSNIEFLGKISDAEKAALLSRAQAFIHPQMEDLGITPIESMAAGRPVIAYGRGGATETVVSGETGVFFAEQTWERLLDTLLDFDPMSWDSGRIRAHALQFSKARFQDELRRFVESKIK